MLSKGIKNSYFDEGPLIWVQAPFPPRSGRRAAAAAAGAAQAQMHLCEWTEMPPLNITGVTIV